MLAIGILFEQFIPTIIFLVFLRESEMNATAVSNDVQSLLKTPSQSF